MSDDSGLRPTPSQDQPPTGPGGDVGRYRRTSDGMGRDLLLDRQTGLRAVDASAADDLQREARFLARLDHPGLPTVYDYVRGDGGAVLVTRPIAGQTLGQAVAAAASGSPPPAIADHAACALTFIRLCEAVAAAHRRGVVHHQLTPDQIVIDPEGQPHIPAWHRAMVEVERPATLRFIANAPVPAALALDGLHEDIRGIGTCLYTALVREAPPRDRDGGLAEVTFAAALAIPPSLAVIVERAMRSDAATGYASVADLGADLTRFVTGLVPQAWTPGPFTRAIRWLDLNRRAVGLTAALMALAAVLALAATWNEVKTYAAWGTPLVEERFDDNSWQDRWQVRGGVSGPGEWETQNGRLVSQAEYDSYLVLRQRLSPPVAIEYTARMDAGVKPGDLSVWWCEGDALAPGGAYLPFLQPGLFVQAGAYENSWCSLYQTPGGRRLAVHPRHLRSGVDHRIRVVLDEERVRMWVDGELTIDFTPQLPLTSGNIGLYAYYPGKQFDDVRVWQREVPELISPLAVGDEAYRAGRFADAALAYGRVAASHRGKRLGERAVFLRGIALRRHGDRDAALAAWESLTDEMLKLRAQCLAIDDTAEAGEVGVAAERLAWMWDKHPQVRSELRQRWQDIGQALLDRKDQQGLATWYDVRERCFPDHRASDWLAAAILLNLERWQDVVERFPDEYRPRAGALISLGRGAEILAGDWAVSHERIQAMYTAGNLAKALASPHLHRDMRWNIMAKSGRAADLISENRQLALRHLGRIDDLLAHSTTPVEANLALLAAGRWHEAAGSGLPGIEGSGKCALALALVGRLDEAQALGLEVSYARLLAALSAGDIDRARSLRGQTRGNRNAHWNSRWFAEGVGLALVDDVLGAPGALRRAVEAGSQVSGAWGGRKRAVCLDALAADGTSAVDALEWATELEALRALVLAVRAELSGDAVAIQAAWSRFLALPVHARLLDEQSPNLEIELTAAWRAAASVR